MSIPPVPGNARYTADMKYTRKEVREGGRLAERTSTEQLFGSVGNFINRGRSSESFHVLDGRQF